MTGKTDFDQEKTALDTHLRALARDTHPSPEFVARLRSSLNREPAAAKPSHGWLPITRPLLAQVGLVLLLVGLVALALFLTPNLARTPGLQRTGTPQPGQPSLPGADSLPNGALARLGRGQILALATAVDGRLAVGSTLGLCIYDVHLTPLWCQPFAGSNGIAGVRFSPSGSWLAVAYTDPSASYGSTSSSHLAVLDAASGALLVERAFRNHWLGSIGMEAGVAWDPSGLPRLAVPEIGEGGDGTVSAWDWQADTLAWGPVEISGGIAGDSQMFALDWQRGSGGESVIAVGGANGLALLDGATGAEKLRLEPTWQVAPVGRVSAVALSPDGRWLAYGYDQGAAALRIENWQVADVKRWQVNRWQPTWLAWGPESAGQPLVMNQKEGASIYTLEGDQSNAVFPARWGPFAWSPDGGLYYARPDGMLGLYEKGEQGVAYLEYSNQPVRIAWDGEGRILSLYGSDIYGWDISTARMGTVSKVTAAYPNLLAVTQDGMKAAYYLESEADIVVWDTRQNHELARAESSWRATDAAFSADGSRLVAIGPAGTLAIFDTATANLTRQVAAAPIDAQIDRLAVSPNGVYAALSWLKDEQRHLDIWDLERGEVITSITPDSTIQTLAFTPDNTRLAGASSGYVSLWDIRSGQQIESFGPEPYHMITGEVWKSPNASIQALAFSPDGSLLATGGSLVTLWNVQEGLPMQAFAGHRGRVISLAFRADGKVLASGASDGTILLWDLGAEPLPRLESPTATPLPLPTPTREAVDLSQYEVSHVQSSAPDGSWQAETLYAAATESSPRQEDYHHITVHGPAGQEWVYEQWTDAENSRTGLSELKWWPLVPEKLYWFENVSQLDLCHRDVSTNLRVMDLNTGAVQSVPGFGPDWQGRLAFSPDTDQFAYVDRATVVIRDLEGVQEQRIPFQPIDENSWGVRAIVYQPENKGIILVQHRPNNLMCDGGPVREGVVAVDVRTSSVLQQDIPEGYSFTGYEADGFALISDADGRRYRLDMHSGEINPSALSPAEEAGDVLWKFLRNLANGQSDSAAYSQAAELYGGSLEALSARAPQNADRPATAAELFQYACEAGEYLCAPVRRIQQAEERDGFHFSVYYASATGKDLILDGQSRFAFWVKKGADGQYRVMTLPPRQQAVDALESFLDLLAEGSRGGADGTGKATGTAEAMFAKAATLFAGGTRALDLYNARDSDLPALLRRACSQGLSHNGPSMCWKAHVIRLDEPPNADRLRLWVAFEQPDGFPWQSPYGQSWYPFTLLRGTDSIWRVADLPLSAQVHGPLASAHLTAAETEGLDDAGILRALWQDYLEQSKSAYLTDELRLLDYEILDLALDQRLESLKAEFNLDAVGWVNFSVKPAKMEYSSWVAGNGEIDGDWIRRKGLTIGYVQEDGISHLRVLGTGP